MGSISLYIKISEFCANVHEDKLIIEIRDLDIKSRLIYLQFIVYLGTLNIRKNVLYLELLDAKLYNWLLCDMNQLFKSVH